MDWFRWHHGCVNDPKFQLVAKKAGASVAEVLAVWACLLEAASASDDRGNPGDPDFEAIDCAMGLQDGQSEAIYQHMRQRGLIAEDGCIASWSKRQPKREREDDNSTERSRSHRAKQRQATPSNATDNTETPRGEERREEKRRDKTHSLDEGEEVAPTVVTPAAVVCRALRKAGMPGVNSLHPTLLALVEAGATEAEFLDAMPKAKGKRDAFEYLLGVVRGRRQDAAETAKTIHRGAMPKDRKATQLATAALMTGAARAQEPPLEAIDVSARILTP